MNFTPMSPMKDVMSEEEDTRRMRIGASVICRRTGVVQAPGNVDKLRRKELDLVSYLYENSARVVTRDELLSKVWHCSMVVTRTVDQTIATLRRKLGDDYRSPRHLITVHGLGYMLRQAA